ncbi:DUF1778 domain-containing protein [Accumulibacter sp.]|uniref:DUF1778 domain-containing protein n=1 Tax=Accumulibacter regalis TaxID=522306 RepID=C7RJS9_ACCRE|nr:DUF1778 domain-containing protein [Accumulibacter sp.]MBN8497547.1 DUF1778 domain-containing protein [Accumulibacter sp.]MBO3716729.1 DUF1778 domain-containing protein [Accumulibacter sp.]
MTSTAIKESRLNIRCDKRARELLERAAAYSHVSISEFVLSQAVASAERVVEANASITLQAADFEAFLAALDALDEPNAALQRAFQRHASSLRK